MLWWTYLCNWILFSHFFPEYIFIFKSFTKVILLYRDYDWRLSPLFKDISSVSSVFCCFQWQITSQFNYLLFEAALYFLIRFSWHLFASIFFFFCDFTMVCLDVHFSWIILIGNEWLPDLIITFFKVSGKHSAYLFEYRLVIAFQSSV